MVTPQLESRVVAKKSNNTKDNPYVKHHDIKCFRRFQIGHKVNECPSWMQLQLVDGECVTEAIEDLEENSYELEEVEGDEGEALNCVLEKILLAFCQPNPSESHTIFRTWCTINGKICELLIDNGSTKNVIFAKVVKALNLPTIKHPKPYKISWVKKRYGYPSFRKMQPHILHKKEFY